MSSRFTEEHTAIIPHKNRCTLQQNCRMATIGDLASFAGPGSSIEEQVAGAIEQNGVLIFGKSWCPYCLEVIDTFTAKAVPFTVLNIDTLPSNLGKKVHEVLVAKTSQKNVPYVFISGALIGGCSDTKALEAAGQLDAQLAPHMAAAAPPRGDEALQIKVESGAANDLAAYAAPGAPLSEQVAGSVAANPVVVFGKSWCPYCLEVVDTFKALNVPHVVFNIDLLSNGAALHEALKSATGQKTVPVVFIGGELIGGCNDTKALKASGELDKKLATALPTSKATAAAAKDIKLPPAFTPAADPAAPKVYHCLFGFPDTVDNHVIRAVAVMVFVLSVFAAAFRNNPIMPWVVLGIWGDFVVRFLAGAQASLLGSLAILLTARIKPELGAGPPKQFAVLVGIIFSGLGALLYWVAPEDNIAGLVVWCILATFAGLEGFWGWCGGCWVFGHLIQLGFMPRTVYTIHLNHKHEVEYMWEDNMKRMPKESIPTPELASQPWNGSRAMRTDLRVKVPKTADYRRQDFDLIKHMKIGAFNALLGITGLALLYKSLAAGVALKSPHPIRVDARIWQVIAIVAGAVYVLFAVLMLLKWALYPSRVRKEFLHPIHGGPFNVPFILLVMMAQLANDNHATCGEGCDVLAKVLFWAGAVPMLALAILRVGDTIAMLKDEEHVHPSWIMPPVGLFIAALIGPKIDASYAEAMVFWYAFAFMMWVLMLALTWRKAMIEHMLDCRQHPMLYIWVAAPAVGCTGYLSIQQALAGGSYPFDFFAKMLMFMSLATFLFLGWGFIRGFFGRSMFSLAEWAYGFPWVALTLALLQYHSSIQGMFTLGMAYTGVVWATLNILIISLHTLTAIARGGVFRNPDEWSPLLAGKYFNEALTMYLDSLPGPVESLDANNLMGIAKFVQGWREFALALQHSISTKNDILYPAVNSLSRGLADKYIGLNTRHTERLAAWHKLLDQLMRSTEAEARSKLLSQLAAAVVPWAKDLMRQLEAEEYTVMAAAEKLFPIKVQCELMRQCWSCSSSAQAGCCSWSDVLPWVLRHLPTVNRRVRYIRTFMWAMPEKLQQVGLFTARGVDAVVWADLTRELPDLVPRGMDGWVPYV